MLINSLRPRWYTLTVRGALATKNEFYRDYTRLPSDQRYHRFLSVKSRTESLRIRSKSILERNIATYVKMSFYPNVSLIAHNHNKSLHMHSDQWELTPSPISFAKHMWSVQKAKVYCSGNNLPISRLLTSTTAMKDLHVTSYLQYLDATCGPFQQFVEDMHHPWWLSEGPGEYYLQKRQENTHK